MRFRNNYFQGTSVAASVKIVKIGHLYAKTYSILRDTSSAKRIVTQLLVIAKLDRRKDFILRGFVCNIIRPSKELYRCKVSNWSARIRCKNWSKLRIKTLERCPWRHSSFFIVNRKHISNFVLIDDFEQANFCWIHLERINTFEDKFGYKMHYVEVF